MEDGSVPTQSNLHFTNVQSQLLLDAVVICIEWNPANFNIRVLSERKIEYIGSRSPRAHLSLRTMQMRFIIRTSFCVEVDEELLHLGETLQDSESSSILVHILTPKQ